MTVQTIGEKMKPHTSNIFCQKSTLFKEYTLCVGCYNASPVTEGFLLKFSGTENTGISGVDDNVTENAWTESFY